jgi:large subunit ribosomal protein L29
MKMTELRNLAREELRKRIVDEEENLAHLEFLHSTRQLESPIKVRLVHRDIARMKTLLRELDLRSVK